MARSYTLAEIDQMRELVAAEIANELRPNGGGGGSYSTDPMRNLAFRQEAQIETQMVEDRLRTYMLAGLGPADLNREKAS